MNEPSNMAPDAQIASVTLAQIERALCYWRPEAVRDSNLDSPNAGTLLLALEELYRGLVAAHRGAVAVDKLSPRVRQALHRWQQTLRDEA